METKKYHGVVIPMVTPFTRSGELDIKSAKKLVNHVIEADTFPFILGTTGECMSMPMEMRLEFVQHVAGEAGGRTTLYAGISDNSLSNSILAAKNFSDWGVQVFVCHVPSYYPMSETHILNYFEKIADNSPCPVMIYNIPSTTHVSIPMHIIKQLSAHPNICGLKDSERSLDRMQQIADMFSDKSDFSIMSGWTSQSANALLSGFDGIVPSTGNFVPKMFSELYSAVIRKDKAAALELQRKIDPIADAHQKDKKLYEFVPLLKVMLNEIGLAGTSVLPPLTELSENDVSQFRDNIKRLGTEG